MTQSVEYRYYNDPQFHRLVDVLEKSIHDCQLTPSELREAAIYAAIRYESRRLTPYFISFTDSGKRDLLNKHLTDRRADK